MKLRMLSQYAGPHGSFKPGDVADFDKDEAKQLIDGGYAEDVDAEEKRLERAEKAVEKAAKKTTAKKDKETATHAGGPEKATGKGQK